MFLRFSFVLAIVVSLVACGTNRVTPGTDPGPDEPTGSTVINLEGVVVETFWRPVRFGPGKLPTLPVSSVGIGNS